MFDLRTTNESSGVAPVGVIPIHTRNKKTRDIGPIEREMRTKIEKLRGTQYPDTFDWSVYDEIAARYGEKPPRGGVVFNTTFKLVNQHASCAKCHYAFEIDSYGRGCVHNCTYCYAKELLIGRGFWNRPMPFPVNLSEIRKIMYTVFETDKPNKWRDVLSKRVPVRIGSMSDSFMWMDYKYKVTQELLRIFNYYRYPHIVFTRSDLAAHDDYMAIYDKSLISIQFSISGDDDKITRLVEPGAPSAERRLRALKKLNDAGFWTTVRLNPFFPMHPDGYFSDEESIRQRFGSKENAPVFPWFTWDLIDKIKESGTPSVLAGVVRLSPFAINAMSKATGIDLKSFFKPESVSGSTDRHYSDKEISHYYFQLKKACHKNGLRFSTCYIGNGEKDYYQYQQLWTNKADCCDAIGNVTAFKVSSQSLLTEKAMPPKEQTEVLQQVGPGLRSIEQPVDDLIGQSSTI